MIQNPVTHLEILRSMKERKPQMHRGKLMKMVGAVCTGGKGTMLRKKRTIHKTAMADNKRL